MKDVVHYHTALLSILNFFYDLAPCLQIFEAKVEETVSLAAQN